MGGRGPRIPGFLAWTRPGKAVERKLWRRMIDGKERSTFALSLVGMLQNRIFVLQSVVIASMCAIRARSFAEDSAHHSRYDNGQPIYPLG